MSEELHVLVVDDDPRMARTIVDILRAKGYEAEEAHSAAEALGKVDESVFDCVLSDIKMPEVDGVELQRVIKRRQPEVPVVLMTAYATDERVKQGLQEGAIATLPKPLDIGLLLTFFSFLSKERTIVIVDDDPEFIEMLEQMLQLQGFTTTYATDLHAVMDYIDVDTQVVLLDMKLNNMDGSKVLAEIRERYHDLPVVLVTGYRAEMDAAIEAALRLGAYTCLYKPLQMEELFQVLIDIRRQTLRGVLEQ